MTRFGLDTPLAHWGIPLTRAGGRGVRIYGDRSPLTTTGRHPRLTHMSVGLVISRLVAATVIGVGVFFASMALTLLLRAGDERSANAIVNDPPPSTVAVIIPADDVVVTNH